MAQQVKTPQDALDYMTPEEALDLVEQVCSKHLGTRNDHVFLNKAIDVLKTVVTLPVPPTE